MSSYKPKNMSCQLS